MYAVDDAVGPQYVLKCGHEHHDSFYSTYLSLQKRHHALGGGGRGGGGGGAAGGGACGTTSNHGLITSSFLRSASSIVQNKSSSFRCRHTSHRTPHALGLRCCEGAE